MARTVFAGAAAVAFCAGAAGVPLAPGDAAFKTDPSVMATPKYTIGLPSYFTGGNVRATLVASITGGLAGTVTSTVYENPETGFVTFEYVFEASERAQPAIARATIGGFWTGVAITDAGADGSGLSGSGDPMPEWTDGDPLMLERDPISDAPSIQWRAFGLGSALSPGDVSARIWFETDQSIWAEARVGVIDTAVVGSGDILAPLSAMKLIPLPSAMGLGLAGLGLVGARRRRGRA